MSQQMRIAVLFQGVFPSPSGLGGGQRRMRDLSKSLSLQCEELIILVPEWNNKSIENPDKEFFKVVILEGGRSKGIPFLNRLNYAKRAELFIKKNKIDTVLFYNNSAEIFFLKKKLKKKGLTILYEQCDLPSSSNSGLRKIYLELAEKYLPLHSDLNIGISNFLIKELTKNAPEIPTVKIPVLVDREVFFSDEVLAQQTRQKYGIKEDDVLIGYAGGTWKDEGLALLLKVVRELRFKFDNLKIIIAGKLIKSDVHDDIRKITEEYELQECCFLPGWVGTHDVKGILSASDILVLPQLKNQFNVAGLPTKVAEYSALGKAIVISEIGDIALYFKDGKNCLLSIPSDFDSLYKNLIRLIANGALRNRLGEDAKHVAQDIFDYKNAGKKIVKALNDVRP
ncbi:glycosyltransferase family 4 protein [Akkermansiaceae bacterium]|nr:glycosyltransferase family 4 protein [Akkermansiaceae bacterium]